MFKKESTQHFWQHPSPWAILCFTAWRAGQQLDEERRGGTEPSRAKRRWAQPDLAMCFVLATNRFFRERRSLTKRTAAVKQRQRGKNLEKALRLGLSPEVKTKNKPPLGFAELLNLLTPPPLISGSIKQSLSTSGFHLKPKLVLLSAYYITNFACRFLLLHIREVCTVVEAVLTWVFISGFSSLLMGTNKFSRLCII